MKTIKILFIAVLTMFTASSFAQKAKKDTAHHASFYTCPMHHDVKMNEPGKCPKCGMDLTLSKKEQMKHKETKTYSCPVHMDVNSNKHGKCPQCGKKLMLSPKEQMKTEVMKIYTCPMHPDIALDKDGKCPKCGADLVEKKD